MNNSVTRPAAGAHRRWVTPKDNPLVVARHGWALARREGLTGVLSGARRFLHAMLRTVYWDNHVRLYHLRVADAAAIPVTAPHDNIHLRVIESREDALELVAKGFENVLEAAPGAKRRLRCGAVAVCAFVDCELASIGWMALSASAKRAVDPASYPVDFAAGEACTGSAFTVRHLRGQGLAAYRFSQEIRYLRNRGIRVCLNSIAADNTPSQRVVERYGATFDQVLHHRRLLGRSSYTQIWRKMETGPEAPRL